MFRAVLLVCVLSQFLSSYCSGVGSNCVSVVGAAGTGFGLTLVNVTDDHIISKNFMIVKKV